VGRALNTSRRVFLVAAKGSKERGVRGYKYPTPQN